MKKAWKLVVSLLLAIVAVAHLPLAALATSGPDHMTIEVEKVWVDSNNQEGGRPASVELRLVDANGNLAAADVNPITVSAATDWKGIFTNVPVNDAGGNPIIYTIGEQPIPGYIYSVSSGEPINPYQYPTNISNVNPDQEETTTRPLVNVPGGDKWHIQQGLTKDHIAATQVVFGSLNIPDATLTEYYADGTLVPQAERVFWKSSSNNRVDTDDEVTFIPWNPNLYPTGSWVPVDHYFTLSFPNAVTILDGTSSGTVRDAVLTVNNFSALRKYNGRDHIRVMSTVNGRLQVGTAHPTRNNSSFGYISLDVNFSVPGVDAGSVLISFVDIDMYGQLSEAVFFMKGFDETFYTIPLEKATSTDVRVHHTRFKQVSDGSMRGYADTREYNDNDFNAGMVARASLADGGFTLRWTGPECSTNLFTEILPFKLKTTIDELTAGGVGGPIMLIVELVIWVLVILAAIALVQAVRRVPVQYAKRVIGNKQYGGVRQYIPLKINAAGVMPIIFAQALMMFPMLLGRYDATRGIAAAFSSYTSVWYNIVFGLLVIIFTYFYTAVTVNPTMMAEDMKKNGGFIPGVKPGKKTAEYLDSIMTKVTLPGSIFLAIIACLPALANVMGVNNQFASFFGGTSLLIMVGVILDTLQQIESYLLMRHYDGLMKTGRLTGRSGM